MRVTRQAIWTVLRAALGIGLAAFLVHLTLKKSGSSADDLRTHLQAANPAVLLLIVLIYGGVIGLTIWRWDFLLRVQGVQLRRWDLIRLSMIGVFFNLVVPGAVGGDLIKMGYIAGEVPDKKAECILTIMLDRVVGVLGLFILATIMVLWRLGFLLGLGPEDRAVQVAAFVVGLGSLGGVVAMLLVEFRGPIMRHPLLARLTGWFAVRLPHQVVQIVERLISALELYRKRRGAVAVALLLSVAVHATLAVNLFLIGRTMGETSLPLRDYFLATQVSNAVASVPLTPAGVGLRDFGIKAFFKTMHATPGTSGIVPVTQTLTILFWAMVGAAFFIFASRKLPPAAKNEV